MPEREDVEPPKISGREREFDTDIDFNAPETAQWMGRLSQESLREFIEAEPDLYVDSDFKGKRERRKTG